MKTTPLRIALTLLLIVLVVVTGVVMLGNSGEQKVQGPPKFLHCTACEFEQPYLRSLERKLCSKCKKGRLAAAASSAEAPVEGLPFYRNPLALALISLTTILAGVHIYMFARARKAAVVPEELYDYYRCGKCNRRLRCVVRPQDRKVLCPTCKFEIDVPAGGSGNYRAMRSK